MLIASVTVWKPKVLQVLDAWLGVDPVGVEAAISGAGLSRDQFAEVILGVIQNESQGNANAVGDGGCSFGLMQFNWCVRNNAAGKRELQYPSNAGDGQLILRTVTSSTQLLDPFINIAVGMKFFLAKLGQFKDVPLSIEAYNNPGTGFFNQDYLNRVLSAIGVSPQFYADLKKKSKSLAPEFWWQRLLAFWRTMFSNVRGGNG